MADRIDPTTDIERVATDLSDTDQGESTDASTSAPTMTMLKASVNDNNNDESDNDDSDNNDIADDDNNTVAIQSRKKKTKARLPAKVIPGRRPIPNQKRPRPTGDDDVVRQAKRNKESGKQTTANVTKEKGKKREQAKPTHTGGPAPRETIGTSLYKQVSSVKMNDDGNVNKDFGGFRDIGISSQTFCSTCGRGSRILEMCSKKNCRNAICVGIDNDDNNGDKKQTCARNIWDWCCPHHGGISQPLKYDATVAIDIQSLEIADFSEQQIVKIAATLQFTSFVTGQVFFASESFHNAVTLEDGVEKIANRWRPNSKHWLFVLTHCNDDGDPWFEYHKDGTGVAATFADFLVKLQENDHNRNINIVFVICGPVLISQEATSNANISERFDHVLAALRTWTTGKIMLFTAKTLEPRNVVPSIMKVIESHEIRAMQLPQAIRTHFWGRTDSSPVWVIINGNGTYSHTSLTPCIKHAFGQKMGKRCTIIEDWSVVVRKCNYPRMSAIELLEWQRQ